MVPAVWEGRLVPEWSAAPVGAGPGGAGQGHAVTQPPAPLKCRQPYSDFVVALMVHMNYKSLHVMKIAARLATTLGRDSN